MRRIGLLALAFVALSCDRSPSESVLPSAPTTGGSAKGDLGAPVGPPIQAVLTEAPQVPPPTGRTVPAKVVVELEVVERTMPISDGVDYTFWTFGGSVPGKFIRVRQGDLVEFHLQNHPDNKMPHNIDLHAVTGPGGGAASSFTAPGHESQFSFKALNQGLYVYHCATAPVGMHVGNGMYGLILVEPPEGLPAVDREYYVMQGDFYTVGRYREKGLQPFDMQKAIDENATYVVFNGSEGALIGDAALTAEVGESVRLYVGNGGPNLVSSFHVIGEIFDRVYTEGGSRWQENVQTTLIPAGGAAIVEYRVEAPGTLVLVDHSIFRAFNKGALGMMKVDGPEDRVVYSGKEIDSVYLADKVEPTRPVATAAAALAGGTLTKEAQFEAGKALFQGTCSACHQADGKGLAGVFPPLAGSDFLMADKDRAIGVVLNGLSGPVTVSGQTYDSVMPPMSQINDDGVAHILTYVRNAWGNNGDAVSPADVARIRASTPPSCGGGALMPALWPILALTLGGVAASDGTVAIEGGSYRPLYPADPKQPATAVAAFRLDARPVTRGEFAPFVADHPEWQRGRVPLVLADPGYLAGWTSPLTPDGRATQPVVGVSWFAARAYCEARRKRLPTADEWEYAARASASVADATGDPAWRAAILAWYGRPSTADLPDVGAGTPNVWGVHDLHGVVWEWVEDFNSILVVGDAREAGDEDRFCGSEALAATDVDDYASFMRSAFRSSLQARYTTGNLGFRCARDEDVR